MKHGKIWYFSMPLIPDDQFKTMLVITAAHILATAMKGCATYTQDMLVGSVVHSSSNDIRAAAFGNALDLNCQSLFSLGSATLAIVALGTVLTLLRASLH